MKLHDLRAGLQGAAVHAICEQALRLSAFVQDPPHELNIDGKASTVTSKWSARFLAASRRGICFWDGDEKQLSADFRAQTVYFSLPAVFINSDVGRTFVEPFPFEVCSLGADFFHEWIKADYRRWSFGRGHVDHGWGCAFRGAGHDRLVSRRWLDFGPWRVIRRPDDTTFIQFHDLALTDPAEAYAQAAPGHQRMGIDPLGGYIGGIDLDVIAGVQGVYRPETRTLDIVVPPGAEVTQQDMRVACGLRLHHRLTQPATDRIDQIAYVFVDQADARAHLHELWLRELACWYLDEAGTHRLDLDYHPTPSPPAWVTALEARGA